MWNGLVRTRNERRRHLGAKHLRGLKVDHQPRRPMMDGETTSGAALKFTTRSAQRRPSMSVRQPSAIVLASALIAGALSMVGWVGGSSGGRLLVPAAKAQRAQKSPTDQLRSQVETLINRLRGRDMPEGIVKSNGRIEATQVDVAAKYPGRLATLTVDEGDEVTAGQRVATISSPETEAQLRAAQAQVLKAKQAFAEAVALIAQRKSDLDFTRTDYDRGEMLIENGKIPQQVVGQRRNKLEEEGAG